MGASPPPLAAGAPLDSPAGASQASRRSRVSAAPSRWTDASEKSSPRSGAPNAAGARRANTSAAWSIWARIDGFPAGFASAERTPARSASASGG
ncbi:hypothetical protein [Sorangium atrum]|uniref:Uncharacterized protein n=1 Tax=Sorangium atrum TaxID=2995308 RepID=A0ABT5C0V7_9BACT|nr:hypothetical protein [Sorangium aterium]MDC0680057.1 hypothetical protein [Sorangium aterium]